MRNRISASIVIMIARDTVHTGKLGEPLSFAAKFVATPQREKSGETSYERFDYQALWGLALVFEQHEGAADYAISFEFHDDIVLLNSASQPTEARFYQVKTKDSGHWTLTDLTRRSAKKKDGKAAKLPSHVGKLYSNYENFPEETRGLSFVSNAPVQFVDPASGSHALESCSAEDFAKFLKKLKAEHPGASEKTAKLIQFVRADLSLHDSATHVKGKLNDFVANVIGIIEYNPDTLYKTIVEECRSKSKFTGAINTFEDLIRHKSITRAQVEGWLDVVRSRQQIPDWAVVVQDLKLGALDLAAIHRAWSRYRAEVLNPGDEAGNRIRDAIRAGIAENPHSDLPITDLLSVLVAKTQAVAEANMTPFTLARLRAMILYEVYRYDPAGEIQTPDPQS